MCVTSVYRWCSLANTGGIVKIMSMVLAGAASSVITSRPTISSFLYLQCLSTQTQALWGQRTSVHTCTDLEPCLVCSRCSMKSGSGQRWNRLSCSKEASPPGHLLRNLPVPGWRKQAFSCSLEAWNTSSRFYQKQGCSLLILLPQEDAVEFEAASFESNLREL